MMKDALKSIEHDEPAGALLSERERWASICAGIAKAYDDQLATVGDPACMFSVDERSRNDAFLVAYYGRRTTPRLTGDATVDENLIGLAAARDALCACTTEDCVRAAQKVVTAAIKPIPREWTAAMDDGVAISDEVSRCADRIEQDVARSRL